GTASTTYCADSISTTAIRAIGWRRRFGAGNSRRRRRAMHDAHKAREAGVRDAQEIAEEAARVFSAEDRGTFFIGTELVSVGPGRAVVQLKICAHHLKSAKVCHGGFIFTLADSALGFASCSHGIQTLAQHADKHWL